jgi:hypothetical protein
MSAVAVPYCGPVDLDRHPAGGGARFDQSERCVRAGVGKQPRALADDHGKGEKVHLVDKVIVEQPPDQGTAAVHLQLTSRLGSVLADGRRDLTGEDGRLRPLRVGECGPMPRTGRTKRVGAPVDLV